MVLIIIYLAQHWSGLEQDRLRVEQKQEKSVTLLSVEHAGVLLVMQHSINIFLSLSSLI